MAEVAYLNEDAIREVIRKFEGCEYAPAEFTHSRHLTVGCWYLSTMSADEALSRMLAAVATLTSVADFVRNERPSNCSCTELHKSASGNHYRCARASKLRQIAVGRHSDLQAWPLPANNRTIKVGL